MKQRFIQETLADFRESGADLPDEVKPEYAEIEAQLSLKTKKFAENVLDSTNAWELVVTDEAELSGLPESAREAARLDALANGHGTEEKPEWRFTQKFTSLQPVLQFADSDDLRRKVWEGSCTIGRGGNTTTKPSSRKSLTFATGRPACSASVPLRTTPPPAGWRPAAQTPWISSMTCTTK